ncbi:hypothetical protein CFC21_085780 [Triticum aestivum]|uniref:non-specific serine/threonine protein kinase n=2 Tax=Triticum aestivum TaxID=4565 RepID=A0A3B6PFZ6_WHEAT|nr:hypothetical protein CFC21_085780 [Triticum aestivum]
MISRWPMTETTAAAATAPRDEAATATRDPVFSWNGEREGTEQPTLDWPTSYKTEGEHFIRLAPIGRLASSTREKLPGTHTKIDAGGHKFTKSRSSVYDNHRIRALRDMAHSYIPTMLMAPSFMLILLMAVSSPAPSNYTDLAALLAFRSQLSDPLAIVTNNWTTNVSFCSWIGVSCSRRHHQRVTALELSGIPLQGELSPHLGNLSFLHTLNLTNTNLAGSIPTDLGRLARLRYLDLGYNSLLDTIPSIVGNLTRLQFLVLNFNQLSGQIPIEVRNMHNLRYLSLERNYISRLVPNFSFDGTPSLSHIYVQNNSLSGSIPSCIGSLLMLQVVQLQRNQLSGHAPLTIFNMSRIVDMRLGINNLTGHIPSNRSFSLPMLQLTGPVPSTLGNNIHLVYIDIRDNHLQGDLSFFASLCNCRQLQTLAISNNPFSGGIPSYFGNLSASLAAFEANNNHLVGGLPATLSNLSGLHGISISDNYLTKKIPESIYKLENLQALAFSGNRIIGPIPVQFGMLRNIVVLELQDNKLSGSIPDAMGNLTMLEYITLSYNHLSSNIPSSLFHGNLIGLDMSHNSLTGALPSDLDHMQNSFGRLTNLATLDLSSNNLSGTIPDYLANFTYLSYLNLSCNRLEGQIPNEGVFSNLTLQSLMGNGGLCGAPRLGLPSCIQKSHPTYGRHILNFILPVVIIGVGAFVALLYLMIRNKSKKQLDVMTSTTMTDLISHRLVSYHEIIRATENFNEDNLLGAGIFGKVFKGKLDDGLMVAIKVLDIQVEQAMRSFDTECQVLRMARHRNLIHILNACSNLDFKALLLQYMPNGSLEKHLHVETREPLGFIERLDIMLGVSEAMEYLHHHHFQVVLHCDLKPSNVLFDDDMTPHVADFGIAKLLLRDDNSMVSASMPGTIGYIAPELAYMGKASRKTDVFSFGIMMLEVFTGRRPTDPMFVGESSLRRWVTQAFPEKLVDVMDEKLQKDEAMRLVYHRQTLGTSVPSLSITCNTNFLMSTFKLGLECSSGSPGQKASMSEVVVRLKKIKKDYSAFTAATQSRTA